MRTDKILLVAIVGVVVAILGFVFFASDPKPSDGAGGTDNADAQRDGKLGAEMPLFSSDNALGNSHRLSLPEDTANPSAAPTSDERVAGGAAPEAGNEAAPAGGEIVRRAASNATSPGEKKGKLAKATPAVSEKPTGKSKPAKRSPRKVTQPWESFLMRATPEPAAFPGAARPRAAWGGAGPVPVPGKSYVIRSGDSLWKIAVGAYGSGTLLKRIVAANPKTLPQGKDSKLIPGKSLFVPKVK